jgi:hypothetical protein
MANRKISDLTALTATATGDLLPIVDISEAAAADQNKKITVENLFKGIPGNVGIGTSSPGAKFEIIKDSTYSNESSFGLSITDGTSDVKLGCGVDATNNISFIQSLDPSTAYNTRPLTLNPNGGSVGIGTASPGAGLQVTNGGVDTAHFGEGTAGAGINIKTRLTTLPTTGTNANIAWLESASGFSAGSLLLSSRPSTGSVVLSATGAANLVIAPSTGNVGIGTTSPGAILHTVNTSAGAATVGAFIQNSSLTAGTEVRLGFAPNPNAVGDNRYSWIGAVNGTGSNDSSLTFATTPGGAGATERMRIDSSGRLLVGTTIGSPNPGFAVDPAGFCKIGNNAGGSGWVFFDFLRSGTTIGTITQSGTTGVAYNTTSDYRLKENVTPVTDGITRLQQLNPSRFNFIADPDRTVDGFIAHEAQAVVPECVTGKKDAVDSDGNPIYQGIDQSKLVPLLTAALQEAIAKIETLEARLTAAGIE